MEKVVKMDRDMTKVKHIYPEFKSGYSQYENLCFCSFIPSAILNSAVLFQTLPRVEAVR